MHTGGRLGKELQQFAALEYIGALEALITPPPRHCTVCCLEEATTFQLDPENVSERIAGLAASRCALTTHLLAPAESGAPAELSECWTQRLAVRPYEVL